MRIFAPWWRTLTALRLAGRELQRNPRQGALVVTMVSIAGVVLMAVGTVFASQQPTPQEQILSELGQNQAWVNGSAYAGEEIRQVPTNPYTVGTVGEPSQLGGAGEAVDVPALLPPGTEAVPIANGQTIVETDDAAVSLEYLAGQAWRPEFAGLYDVVEGVVPAARDEVMLSPRAAELLDVGVGDTVTVQDADLTATVTGILAQDRRSGREFVVLPSVDMVSTDEQPWVTWYLPNLAPTWAQIQEWNESGVVAYSSAVALDPPQVYDGPSSGSDGIAPAMIATAGIGLIALALLAGSAFSVGFRRDRRRLALLAATGAGRGSITGVGVATGLLLGLVGGVVGAVVGLGAGWGWIAFLSHFGGASGESSVWGYHWNPWHGLAAIAFCALAGALSALVPASAASRLDVMSALRGARKPTPHRRWMSWMGGVLVVVGVALNVFAARRYDAALDMVNGYPLQQQGSNFQIAGFAATLAGLVLVTGVILRGLARALAPVSVAARLAARDAARSIGRTVPVIAAIGATMAIFTTVVLLNQNQTSQWVGQRDFRAPLGDGLVGLDQVTDAGATDRLVAAVDGVLPEATVTVVKAWSYDWQSADALVPVVAIPEDRLCPREALTPRQIAEDERCTRDLGSGSSVAVGGAAELRAILGHDPSADALDVLAKGGMVAFDPAFVTDGTVDLQFWDFAAGNYPDEHQVGLDSTPDAERELPAVAEQADGGWTRAYAGLISPATAADIGYPVVPNKLFIHGDGGITEKQQTQLNAALTRAGGGWLSVERITAFARDQLLLAYAALAAALLVAGATTGVALGLARADARRDDFTLASLGAAPGMTRASAGWQGAIISGVAAAIGVATGLLTSWAQGHQLLGVDFAPPWLWLGVAVVVTPTVVGLLSAAFTRPVRVTHYRLAA